MKADQGGLGQGASLRACKQRSDTGMGVGSLGVHFRVRLVRLLDLVIEFLDFRLGGFSRSSA